MYEPLSPCLWHFIKVLRVYARLFVPLAGDGNGGGLLEMLSLSLEEQTGSLFPRVHLSGAQSNLALHQGGHVMVP